MNDLRKCCLELDPIPENYTGPLIVSVPTDQVSAQSNVKVIVYRSGIQSPLYTNGTTLPPLPNSIMVIADNTDLAPYYSRYSTITIEAFNDSDERIFFVGSDGNSYPSICFCIKPCVPGLADPEELYLNEKAPLCEDIVCA